MKKFATIFFLLFSCLLCRGQVTSIGLYNSFKGFGVNLTLDNPRNQDKFKSISLCADMYGLMSSKTSEPGISCKIIFGNVIRSFSLKESTCELYAGPGFSLGYVSDFEKGVFDGKKTVFSLNKGAAACLSGRFGACFYFSRNISLDLSVTMDLGLHIRKNESGQNIIVNLYKNGIYQALWPELTISYCFGGAGKR